MLSSGILIADISCAASLSSPQVQDKQQKLDSLASSLKQIEKYNEQMNSEIAVKRREAYATEEAVQKLEKEKMEQDFLIDGLQVGAAFGQILSELGSHAP